MSDNINYNLGVINEKEADKIVVRLLRMVHDKDILFTCLNDQIISDMIIQDYIEIDMDNETMQGTELTEKGRRILDESFFN